MQQASAARGSAAEDAVRLRVAAPAKLYSDAVKAQTLSRFERALVLYERAFTAAQASFPDDALVLAKLRLDKYGVRMLQLTHETARSAAAGNHGGIDEATRLLESFLADSTWLDEIKSAEVLLHRRWCAGTLFELTPEERCYFDASYNDQGTAIGAWTYVGSVNAMLMLLSVRHPAYPDDVPDAHILRGGLLAALQLEARGCIATMLVTDAYSLKELLQRVLRRIGVSFNTLPALRSLAGLTLASESSDLAGIMERGNADVARHGLRRCALPECGAQEPHPKLFKVCGRCRSAAYCGSAHCAQDWRRHKRAECSPKPDDAA